MAAAATKNRVILEGGPQSRALADFLKNPPRDPKHRVTTLRITEYLSPPGTTLCVEYTPRFDTFCFRIEEAFDGDPVIERTTRCDD